MRGKTIGRREEGRGGISGIQRVAVRFRRVVSMLAVGLCMHSTVQHGYACVVRNWTLSSFCWKHMH